MSAKRAEIITVKDIRSGEFCRIMGTHRFMPLRSAIIAPEFVVCVHCGATEKQPKKLRLVKS